MTGYESATQLGRFLMLIVCTVHHRNLFSHEVAESIETCNQVNFLGTLLQHPSSMMTKMSAIEDGISREAKSTRSQLLLRREDEKVNSRKHDAVSALRAICGKRLLELGMNPFQKDGDGKCPLVMAALDGQAFLLKEMLNDSFLVKKELSKEKLEALVQRNRELRQVNDRSYLQCFITCVDIWCGTC